MQTASFSERRPGHPNFSALPPPQEIPSTRYPNHALPAITTPNSNDNHVGPHEATAAGPSSTAALPVTSSSSSYAVSSPQPAPISPNTSRTSAMVNSNILTPASGISSDGLSPSSGGNTGSSQSSQTVYYGHQWGPGGTSQSSAYTYANPNSASGSSPVVGQQYSAGRSIYGAVSPSLSHFGGRTSSSTNGDNISNPPAYQDQGHFQTAVGPGGASLSSAYSQAPVAPPHSALSQSILNSQNPSGTQPPTPTQQTATSGGHQTGQEAPAYRAPPTPSSYYPPSSTPQQSSFAAFNGHPSPTTHSPTTTTTGGPSRTLSALTSGMTAPLSYGRPSHMPPLGAAYPSPYTMPNTVLSNIHQPGTPMSMVGSMGISPYHHGIGHHPHHLYGGHGGPPPGDRPFKCDECTQSFNRNHDLKRHKRIHLAVKPFPCTFCDKSFSRKDALKRHKLVKGCGSNAKRETESAATGKQNGSPPARGDAVGDETAQVPMKREQHERT